MITKVIFIVLAAICKTVVDTIVHHKGGRLPKIDFFDITKQGHMLPFPKYPLDGFHIFNSLMILFFIIAITINPVKVVLLGVAFILVFNLFWNKILN